MELELELELTLALALERTYTSMTSSAFLGFWSASVIFDGALDGCLA